ncbi:glycosyltransferase [Flavicella marina]|uniref:glycosyltransferase n=1 Tax=Flavicella marina TaxID=1475951 RepID=UPI0012645EC2|nr:glycosyltransferase [Flavicella marina]
MKITIVYKELIPAKLYGGTQRVIWGLGKELTKLGHEVVYLVKKGSYCDFAQVKAIDDSIPIVDQVPSNSDVVHFQFEPEELTRLKIPYVITMHGNVNHQNPFDKNTIFVSKNHAERHNSDSFVHNGLDWNEYNSPNFSKNRSYFHFLGNAAWRVKNVQGAIDVIKNSKTEQLKVLGGVRFNFNMGLRLTFSTKVSFAGMVDEQKKASLINQSKGLIFPIKWHEPFGLAITESLYYGCPVFATPYGSLPELVNEQVGFLSNSKETLTDAVKNSDAYSPKTCHEYAKEQFNSKLMTMRYLEKYERVMSKEKLNSENPKLVKIQTDKYLAWK